MRNVFFISYKKTFIGSLFVVALLLASAEAARRKPSVQEEVAAAQAPLPRYHLTARPWQPLSIPREKYLDAIEGICRFTVKQQDTRGAVIDPFLKREHQYSTPYYAYAVGLLVHEGRAKDLLASGALAMEHATACFAEGSAGIPDQHGEFFIPSLTGALHLYAGLVPTEQMTRWRERMQTSLEKVINVSRSTRLNNWRTYAMKGEWLRAQAGLVPRTDALQFIHDSWLNATQRARIADDRWHLYQDHSSDPEPHAVEAVGRGNLLALAASGYDGELRDELWRLVTQGTAVSLLLQDPSGQCPPNGRTDDHIFNDVLYQLCFEVMAEHVMKNGDARLAGQYRRAAQLSFNSIARWQRTDGAWAGSYFVTKNHFDPADRVGYQRASNYGNYNGAVMIHLAEAYEARRTEIAEQATPVEIGGYALATDPRFASAVANAGGMQMFADLRGDTALVFDHYWSALGVVRFGRVGWETRLGPSDGIRDAQSKRGISFAPTWREANQWVRMADLPERYQAEFKVEFAHPLLVRCAIIYQPRAGQSGPTFRHEFTLTPAGVLATLRQEGTAASAAEFGVTWPLLENDGRPLKVKLAAHSASVAYAPGGDEQHFLALQPQAVLTREETPLQSTYGWLRSVRADAPGGSNQTFVYPRNPADPSGERVRQSFRLTSNGFSSVLGRVIGQLYVGRTAAGGVGDRVDLNGDGRDDVRFSAPCGFMLQLKNGRVTAVEADRAVAVTIAKRRLPLTAYQPVFLNAAGARQTQEKATLKD